MASKAVTTTMPPVLDGWTTSQESAPPRSSSSSSSAAHLGPHYPPPASVAPSSPPPRSTFKTALSEVPVPDKLMEGVNVIKVSTNGKMKKAFLTLSEDKFTIYVTSHKVKCSSSSTALSLVKPMLRKVRSISSSGDGGDGDSNDPDSAVTERAIDVGAIDRFQRGQSTLKFEQARKSLRSQNASQSPRKLGGKGGGAVPHLESGRSFSIIFRGERTLDLMTTEGGDSRDEILDALDSIVDAYKRAKVRVGNDVLLLRYIWLDVDKDKSNTIDKDELGKVLDRINFYMSKKQLEAGYVKFAKTIGLDRSTRRRGLTFEQCVTFLHKVKRDTWQVKPVNQIWIDLFGEFMRNGKQRTRVSAETFLERFLRKKQGEKDSTIERVRGLFLQLNRMEIADVASAAVVEPDMWDRHICRDRFEAYLVSRENDVFDPMKERHDPYCMDKPLSEYWISSSHNTYLTGDQITSTSTAEMYMHVLYRGCRCVEIDIWDGVDPVDGSPIPIVKHGHTMTTQIPFSDIIKCIKVFLNFNPDSYPIILSLENHCNLQLQEVMADLLTIILGHRLYVPDEQSLDGPLPSPESLRGMVVLKGRRPVEAAADEETVEYDTDDEGSLLSSSKTQQTASSSVSQSPTKIAPQLARLTLFHGTNFKNWHESRNTPDHHMHSFVESKVRSLCKSAQNRREWVTYNQTHMSRVFPAGTRVDSSNYNPILAWSTGCQMAALNFQTSETPPLRINDGRFRENGGCGYVLKPSLLTMKDHTVPASVRLSVRVLAGSCLPKPKGQKRGECIDPYVRVELFDASATQDISQACLTQHVNSNGFFPIWNQETFAFDVENGDVAILQLTVWDRDPPGKSDDFIASASVPISCLRQGYRSVRLYDANNTQSGAFDFASLLIEVKMKRVVEEI